MIKITRAINRSEASLMAGTMLGLLLALLTLLSSVKAVEPVAAPTPLEPTPNARQLRWQGFDPLDTEVIRS